MGLGFEVVELLVEESAGVFDIVDVARVAEAAFATKLLRRATAAGFEGFGFLVCGGHGGAVGRLLYDSAMFWADRGFVSIWFMAIWFMAICEKRRALELGRDNGISNEWGRYDEMAWAIGFAGLGLGSHCDRRARVEPIGALLSIPQ
jgi:hypothetical protein